MPLAQQFGEGVELMVLEAFVRRDP